MDADPSRTGHAPTDCNPADITRADSNPADSNPVDHSNRARPRATGRRGVPASRHHRKRTFAGITAAAAFLTVTGTALPGAQAAGIPAVAGHAVHAVTTTLGRATRAASATTTTSRTTDASSSAQNATSTTTATTTTTTSATTTATSASTGALAASTSPTSAVAAIVAKGSTTHSCSGVVIDSPAGNLVVTAAHCLSGSAVGTTVEPGYANGTATLGRWTVTAAYATSAWTSSQSASDDLVVLVVAPRTIDGISRSIESVAGGVRLGTSATSGTLVHAWGYVTGADDAVGCTTRTTLTTSTTSTTTTSTGTTTTGSPTLACSGFAGGTSGGPWLEQTAAGWVLRGIVGGLHQGGCSADVSYSPTLTTTATTLATRAESGAAASTLPVAGSDGC